MGRNGGVLGIVIGGYALILNSLASCACDAIEPPVPPAAHKVACIPDKIVVRVSGRYGVKVFAEAFCDIVTLYSVSGCPWCRDKEAIGVDPSFQFGMGVCSQGYFTWRFFQTVFRRPDS